MSKLLKYSQISKRTFSIRHRTFNKAENIERSFIMVKPDGIQRSLVGEVIARLEKRGFKLLAIKISFPSDQLIRQHYKNIVDKPFFPSVLKYIKSGPVIPMVWEGGNIIEASRVIIGHTNPLKSHAGTIRADFCVHPRRNLVHGSTSVEDANTEIALWFKPEEITNWDVTKDCWIYELKGE